MNVLLLARVAKNSSFPSISIVNDLKFEWKCCHEINVQCCFIGQTDSVSKYNLYICYLRNNEMYSRSFALNFIIYVCCYVDLSESDILTSKDKFQ